MKNIFFYALIACVAFTSCSKSKDINTDINQTGQIKLKFDPIVSGKKLVLNTYQYSNHANETFTVETAKFFISNIKLTAVNGEVHTLPKKESIFLINSADEASLYPSFQIPQGEYKTLTFNLGIDSLTNTLPVEERTGVLDIAQSDMYWSWNSGYIFFKMEGTSPQSTTPDKKFRYHIGLYGGYNNPSVNNNRIVVIDLQKAGIAKVQQNLSADIHLMVDFGKIFDGKYPISIAQYSTVMTTGPHQQIADNYSQLFTHDHTHNFQTVK